MVTAVAGFVMALVLAPFALVSSTATYAGLLVAAPSVAFAPPPAPPGDQPVVAQAAPPPLPQPPAAEFFYSENGKPVGPVTLAEIQAKIASGTITPDTLVWKSGTPNWV